MEKIIKDRINALRSRRTEMLHKKLTKDIDIEKAHELSIRIEELEMLMLKLPSIKENKVQEISNKEFQELLKNHSLESGVSYLIDPKIHIISR